MLSVFSPTLAQEWPDCFPPLRVRLCRDADTFLSSPKDVCVCVLESLDKFLSLSWLQEKASECSYLPWLKTSCAFATSVFNHEKVERGRSFLPPTAGSSLVVSTLSKPVVRSKAVSSVRTTVGYLVSKKIPTSFFPYPDPSAPRPRAKLDHVISVVRLIRGLKWVLAKQERHQASIFGCNLSCFSALHWFQLVVNDATLPPAEPAMTLHLKLCQFSLGTAEGAVVY